MSLTTLKPRTQKAMPKPTGLSKQASSRANSDASSIQSSISLDDNQEFSLNATTARPSSSLSSYSNEQRTPAQTDSFNLSTPYTVPSPQNLLDSLENAMYSNLISDGTDVTASTRYEHHDETYVDGHYACIAANVSGTQFSINGVLPASFLYSTSETLSQSEDGTSQVVIRRRQIKSATLVITFDDLTTREIEVRQQPDLLCTIERSLQDPVSGEVFPLANVVSQLERAPHLSSSALKLHAVNVPVTYEAPVITIAPVSNLTGYNYLSASENIPLAFNLVKHYTRTLLNSFERTAFFNFFRFLKTETLARSTLHSNYILSNNTKTSHRLYNIYGNQVTGNHITDVINCCDCPHKLNATVENVDLKGMPEFTPITQSVATTPSNLEYHYPHALGVSTLLPMIFDKRIVPGLDCSSYPSSLGLKTKLDTEYIYAEYAGSQKMTTVSVDPKSNTDYKVSFHFYSATDVANSDTSFPSQRPLYTDTNYVGTCLIVSTSSTYVFNVAVYYTQDNLIIECFSNSSKVRTYHFRLNGFNFTTISNLFVQYQPDLLSDLCQSMLDNIFSPNHTPDDLFQWYTPQHDMANIETHLFNTIPLGKFVTTPEASYFGSNILELLSTTIPYSSFHACVEEYLRSCCAHAGTMLSGQFARFPSLPVTSRNKYTDHYYDTPTMWSDPKYSEHSRTFSVVGLIPIGGLSTHLYKALFSRAKTQVKNGVGAKYGLGYNSFDFPYYSGDRLTDQKVYICELCHQLYPSCFGSLFCKAKHIASQTLLVADKESLRVRAAYTHYLLPHVANAKLVNLLVGQGQLNSVYNPKCSKVYRLYSNQKDADLCRNALTFFISRHVYDPNSGKYVSSDPYDTKIDVRAFLPLRPSGHSDHSIRVFITNENSKRRLEGSRSRQQVGCQRGRSNSRVVNNTKSQNRQRYRDTSSVRNVKQSTNYVLEVPSKPSSSVKSRSFKCSPPVHSILTNYISNFTPDATLSKYKDNTLLYNSSDKMVSALNKFRYDRVKNIARTLNPILHDYKTAFTFFSSVRPDFFKTLGEFDLDCFATYDNAKCTNYCSDWKDDTHSLGNFFEFNLTSYLSTCGGLRQKRLYAFPPPDDTVISEFLNRISNTSTDFEIALLIPSKYSSLVTDVHQDLTVYNTMALTPMDYDGFPLLISGNVSTVSYDATTLDYTLFNLRKQTPPSQ